MDERDVERELRQAISGLDPAAALAELCRLASELLSVSAATVSLRTADHPGSGYVLSGRLAEAMTDVEFVLGEGPAFDAYDGRRPVLVADLGEAASRWSEFTPAAIQAGTQAVFVFPLQVGAIRLGTLTLFRDQPGELVGGGGVQSALAVAELLLAVLLGMQSGAGAGALPEVIGGMAGHRAVVHQATGVIAAQLDVGVDEALLRLRGFAFADGRPINDVADQVVEGKLRFDVLDEVP